MSTKYFPVIDMVATGRNISELRKARGLAVADLQEYFGFDAPQAIYKWQKGLSLPSTDNLYALSFLFGISIEEILVPIKPRFQTLPQEKSCGSGRFGALCGSPDYQAGSLSASGSVFLARPSTRYCFISAKKAA